MFRNEGSKGRWNGLTDVKQLGLIQIGKTLLIDGLTGYTLWYINTCELVLMSPR